MAQITPHFSESEASCRDEYRTPLPEKYRTNAEIVASNVEVLRKALGDNPIKVNSWYRTPEHNAKQKGASPNSHHLTASAMDISSECYTPEQMYLVMEALIRLGIVADGGLGLYDSFIHYDFEDKGDRWDRRTKK